jgi:serine/threonine-protein kinase 24/25/MST4
VLDRVDPEGEWLLLRSIGDAMRAEPKLAAALGLPPSQQFPPSAAASPLPDERRHSAAASVAFPSSAASSFGSDASTKVGTPAGTRAGTPLRPSARGVMPPPATPSLAKPRLILAQSNPHLKSHRRRQSAIVGGAVDARRLEEARLPGLPGFAASANDPAAAGLSDVLYAKWVEGLKARWGMG